MRVIVLYILFFCILEATNIRWYSNYDKALIEAKKQNKNLMIFVMKKDSNMAKDIFVNIFQDKQIAEFINKNYVSVVSIYEYKNSYPIELFYTSEFPALFFVSNTDESFIVKPLFGVIKKDEVKNSLKIFQHTKIE